MPFLFKWRLNRQGLSRRVLVRDWGQEFGGKTAREWKEQGALHLDRAAYFLVPTRDPRRFANQYGVLPGLLWLPVAAILDIAAGDLAERPRLLWYGAKTVAAALVAGSAVFLFFSLLNWLSLASAALLALIFGVGTCVWAISSQALWQQTANLFFLSAGTWAFFLSFKKGRPTAVVAGILLGLAVFSRPLSAIPLVAVAGYYMLRDRRQLAAFLLGGLPVAMLWATYNWVVFGSILDRGQLLGSQAVALVQTGSPEIWQTSTIDGLLGILVSPSRGLLIFSPFLLFSFAGALLAWRERRYEALRLLSIAVTVHLLVVCHYFSWWGGWSFGYRYLVDQIPFLILCLVPCWQVIRERRFIRLAFVGCVVFSVTVQVLGAFSYHLHGWNARQAGYRVYGLPGSGPVVVQTKDAMHELLAQVPEGHARVQPNHLDIDRPDHRHRLWSISDNQILWHLQHFSAARATKKKAIQSWLADPTH